MLTQVGGIVKFGDLLEGVTVEERVDERTGLSTKVVIDTNNYYPQRDGRITELEDESTTTSELLQAHLPTSKVVKARQFGTPVVDEAAFGQLLRDVAPADGP